MATMAEALENLDSLKEANLLKVIDISKKFLDLRKFQYSRLQIFLQKRKERIDAIVEAWEDVDEENSTTDEYRIFQTTLKTVLQKNTDLDEVMGLLNRTIYGEVKQFANRKREQQELVRNIALLGTAATMFDQADSKIQALKNLL